MGGVGRWRRRLAWLIWLRKQHAAPGKNALSAYLPYSTFVHNYGLCERSLIFVIIRVKCKPGSSLKAKLLDIEVCVYGADEHWLGHYIIWFGFLRVVGPKERIISFLQRLETISETICTVQLNKCAIESLAIVIVQRFISHPSMVE